MLMWSARCEGALKGVARDEDPVGVCGRESEGGDMEPA
jgi:hypothetical protein